jgi:hypothetical protein
MWLPVMLPPCLAGEASAEWPSVLKQLGSLVGGQPDAFLDDIKAMRGSDMQVVVPASGEAGWHVQHRHALGAGPLLTGACERTGQPWQTTSFVCAAVFAVYGAVAAHSLLTGTTAFTTASRSNLAVAIHGQNV